MLKQFRKDYGFTLKDCERLSGFSRQSISYFEEKEDRKKYFVTNKMSKYIDWVRKYRATHLSIKEMAECLEEEAIKKEISKTIWQKIKDLLGVK